MLDETTDRQAGSPGIHASLLPPQGPIVIWPPSKDVPREEQLWLVGFPAPNGTGVPLGRVVWFGDMDCEGSNDEPTVLEEHDCPPEDIEEFVRANLPGVWRGADVQVEPGQG